MPCAGRLVDLSAAKSFAPALLAFMPHATVLVFNRESELQYANGGALKRAGYDPEAMTGRPVRDALPDAAWEMVGPVYARALAGEEFTVYYKSPVSKRRYRLHGSPVLDDDGAVQGGMLVAVEAVTEAEERLTTRLRQQSAVAELGKFAITGAAELEALIKQAARLVSETLTVDALSVVELRLDRQDYLVRFETTGEFVGQRVPMKGSIAAKVLSAQAPVVIDDAARPEHEVPPALLAVGARSIAYVPIGPVTDPFGMLGAFSRRPSAFTSDDVHFLEAIAFVLNEAATRAKTDAELRHQALHDVVTGLPNRTLLNDRLKHALAVSARAGLRTAVLFIDLDRFKDINDSLGHDAGDEVLRAVATRLRSAVRGSDTVARFGGDEFVIAAAALETENDAIRIAEAVLTLLEAPILIGHEQVYVRASIGICFAHPDAAQEPRALITEADAAMYRAKARGRNRYEPSTPRTWCRPRTG
jgi:diguanylate cyclase (GGDEF)-like protein/PAS domain S-box-containing protein